MSRLILASASPRRRELVRAIGLDFDVIPSRLEESFESAEDPGACAERLARMKAEAVAQKLEVADGRIVLGADTIVVADSDILGKPRSADEAQAMLTRLSGRAHDVITGVVFASPGVRRILAARDVSRVYFRALSPQEIAAYVASGEPLDKAGAYAVQGSGARLLERIEGSYTNVMGLPVGLVLRLLREWEKEKG